MTDNTSSNNSDFGFLRSLLAWMTIPLALFPLVALLTYDWRAIAALNAPATPSTNWIGPLGDAFAYYGYTFFGLAIWIVPIVCVVFAIGFVRGKRVRSLLRNISLLTFLFSSSCLLQVFGAHATFISNIVELLNIQNAGGCIGYLMVTRLLTPLVSDFGASVIMLVVMTSSLIAAVGFHTLTTSFAALIRWALAPRQEKSEQENEYNPSEEDSFLARARAAREARAAAKEAARQEKEAARLEKKRLKEEMKLLKTAPASAPIATSPARAESSDAADDKGPYVLPPLSLLNPLKKTNADHSNVGETSKKLIDTLKLFDVDAVPSYTIQGPVVTKYALKLAPGIRYSAVTNLSDNLMGALHAKSLRIEAPIPGEECVGIEVPNLSPAGISFREIIESKTWREFDGELPLLFGKDAAGNNLIADLASMPHMLVAGATGQGKSVCLNSIINGLLMTKTPEQLKLIMVDPKSVEFSSYASLPHLIVPVITDNKKVVFSLRWAVAEMEKRLKLFARARVRNIYDFNHRLSLTQTDMFGNDSEVGSDMPKTLPYIVIIIDEVADLMLSSGKEVTPDISRLTAKARAAGIHLILATQRPDAKIITGTIKANVPGRVAFKTSTSIDSRTILDDGGAENLIGRGDMLFKTKDGQLIRAQGAWISDPEIARIVSFIEQHSNVQFDQRFTKKLGTIKEEEIDLFAETEEEESRAKNEAANQREQVKAEENASDFKKAIECIINTNRASTSHFQRKLTWGYNHAAKIMDMLEDAGVIGPQTGAGPRQIIMSQEELLAILNGGATEETKTTEIPIMEINT